MHEYQAIKVEILEAFDGYSFTQESENLEVDYYGSMQCILVSNDHRLLVQWDGEEGFGFVEYWNDGEWKNFETTIPENEAAVFQTNIKKLCSEIQLLIQ